MGFKIGYASTDVSHWSYSYSECGGNFTTQNGLLTSPSYPYNYPNNADCVYTISHPTGTVILLTFHSMDTESDFDTLEIRDGNSLDSLHHVTFSGYNMPHSLTMQSRDNQVWLR